MAKRLVLIHNSRHDITTILETLRSFGIKAPAGGMVDSAATILVEDADVQRAIHRLAVIGIEVRNA